MTCLCRIRHLLLVYWPIDSVFALTGMWWVTFLVARQVWNFSQRSSTLPLQRLCKRLYQF